jgi:hypothetical protein
MESGQNRLVFTIKEVKQYTLVQGDKNSGIVVAGKRISANIAFFNEPIKPLVLNAGNSKIMKGFNNSSFVEDWANTTIELYIKDGVSFGKETTSGVRIKPNQPSITKPELKPENKKIWENAIVYLKGKGTIEGVKKSWSLSATNEQKLKDASI